MGVLTRMWDYLHDCWADHGKGPLGPNDEIIKYCREYREPAVLVRPMFFRHRRCFFYFNRQAVETHTMLQYIRAATVSLDEFKVNIKFINPDKYDKKKYSHKTIYEISPQTRYRKKDGWVFFGPVPVNRKIKRKHHSIKIKIYYRALFGFSYDESKNTITIDMKGNRFKYWTS